MWRLVGLIAIATSVAAQSPDEIHRRRLEDFSLQAVRLDAKFEAHSFQGRNGRKMPYRLFRPTNGSGRLPLVLYLHGSGGLGDDNSRQVSGGNVFGTHVWAFQENQSRNPAFVVAPQTNRGWGPADLTVALELVQTLMGEEPIDPARIYLTGQSMGGTGAWNMLAEHVKFFAAAVIVCGGGNPELVNAARATPIWIFHGTLDKTIPVENARLIAEALNEQGTKPKYTEYPKVGHNVWEWAYTEPELLEWVFSQRRTTFAP